MKTIHLNYIGRVDHGDWGATRFKLTDLFTRDELAAIAQSATADFELEMSAELATENTNGQLCTRVRLKRIEPEADDEGRCVCGGVKHIDGGCLCGATKSPP